MITVKQFQTDARAKFQECLQIAANKGFPITARFEIFWQGSKGGDYTHKTKLIRVNGGLAIKNEENYRHVIDVTIPHECAHAVQFQHFPAKKSHDHYWKYAMRMVYGLDPVRCHDMDTARVARHHARPYRYACPRCRNHYDVTQHVHNKMKTGKKYFCNKCKSSLTFIGPAINK